MIETMTVRIDFPFAAQFDFPEPGNNSRELRTLALHEYLRNSGMELGNEVEAFEVVSFRGADDGEFWDVKAGR